MIVIAMITAISPAVTHAETPSRVGVAPCRIIGVSHAVPAVVAESAIKASVIATVKSPAVTPVPIIRAVPLRHHNGIVAIDVNIVIESATKNKVLVQRRPIRNTPERSVETSQTFSVIPVHLRSLKFIYPITCFVIVVKHGVHFLYVLVSQQSGIFLLNLREIPQIFLLFCSGRRVVLTLQTRISSIVFFFYQLVRFGQGRIFFGNRNRLVRRCVIKIVSINSCAVRLMCCTCC